VQFLGDIVAQSFNRRLYDLSIAQEEQMSKLTFLDDSAATIGNCKNVEYPQRLRLQKHAWRIHRLGYLRRQDQAADLAKH
jgi:hypothetical protein